MGYIRNNKQDNFQATRLSKGGDNMTDTVSPDRASQQTSNASATRMVFDFSECAIKVGDKTLVVTYPNFDKPVRQSVS